MSQYMPGVMYLPGAGDTKMSNHEPFLKEVNEYKDSSIQACSIRFGHVQ